MLQKLLESKEFYNGVAVGVNIHQQKVVMSSERKEPLKIGDDLYYIQSGRERLQEAIEKFCQ